MQMRSGQAAPLNISFSLSLFFFESDHVDKGKVRAACLHLGAIGENQQEQNHPTQSR